MKVTDEIRDKIVTSVLVFGKRKSAVAKDLGVSVASVCATCSLFDYVKGRDWQEARKLCLSRNVGMNAVRWAVSALNATPPTGCPPALPPRLRRSGTMCQLSGVQWCPACPAPGSLPRR